MKYKVGRDQSRCTRTVVLDDGRLVRIGATVTIDKVTGGGTSRSRWTTRPASTASPGRRCSPTCAKQYAAKYGGKTPSGSCPPFLRGRCGATITCTLDSRKASSAVQVKVSRVDPKSYSTEYLFKAVS